MTRSGVRRADESSKPIHRRLSGDGAAEGVTPRAQRSVSAAQAVFSRIDPYARPAPFPAALLPGAPNDDVRRKPSAIDIADAGHVSSEVRRPCPLRSASTGRDRLVRIDSRVSPGPLATSGTPSPISCRRRLRHRCRAGLPAGHPAVHTACRSWWRRRRCARPCHLRRFLRPCASAEDKADDFRTTRVRRRRCRRDGYADVIVGAPGQQRGGKGAGPARMSIREKTASRCQTLTGEHAVTPSAAPSPDRPTRDRLLLIVGAPNAGSSHSGRLTCTTRSEESASVHDSRPTTRGWRWARCSCRRPEMSTRRRSRRLRLRMEQRRKGSIYRRVYVHSGKDGHRLLTLTGETAGEARHESIGRGRRGRRRSRRPHRRAWQYSGEAIGAGRAYLFSGKDGHLVRTYTSRIPGDTFGFDAVTLGDVDGDGITDS